MTEINQEDKEASSHVMELELEIDGLKKKIPGLEGKELYDAARGIVEKMDTVFCILQNLLD